MTNSPQIPTIPQDVREAVNHLKCTAMLWGKDSAGKIERDNLDDTEQALLTAIAAHLRHIGADVEIERVKEILMYECTECAALYQSEVTECECTVGRPFTYNPMYAHSEPLKRLLAAYQPRSHEAEEIWVHEDVMRIAINAIDEVIKPTTQPNESSTLPDVGDKDVVEMVERVANVIRTTELSHHDGCLDRHEYLSNSKELARAAIKAMQQGGE